jgi:hypothetical protein
MINLAPTLMFRDLLADLIRTIATLAVVGMLCTIGVELVVIIAHYFGAP